MNTRDAHEPTSPARSGRWSRIVALVASLAITVGVLVFREQLAELGKYGYLGVFLVSILGNATIILPVPSLAVVFAGGSVLNPLIVGLVAGLGEPLGELTGYLAGYAGSAVVEDSARFRQIRDLVDRRGFLTLFVLSAIPNPVFDLAGIAAGMARYPVLGFLLPCWLGKTLKSIVIAYLGSLSLDWLSRWLG
ncbi:MAG: VTT domain-containing protein [Anaerolineae bacterium]